MIQNFFIDEPYKINFKADIKVDSKGIFRTTLPKDISKIFTDAGINLRNNRSGRAGFFEGERLADVVKDIDATISNLCSRELVSDKMVIRYQISTAGECLKDENGNYWPNGTYAPKGDWIDTTQAASSFGRIYGFQVYTEVCIRREYVFTSTGKNYIQYDEPEFGHHSPDDPEDPIEWLDNLVRQSMIHGEPLYEIEGTKENAEFFKSLYVQLFKLNEKMTQLAEPENLLANIDSKILLRDQS